MTDTGSDPRRAIPRTDTLLAAPEFAARSVELGADTVKSAIRDAQRRARVGDIAPADVASQALAALDRRARPTTLRPVLNATGVVLHTNLGRAPLSPAARAAMTLAGGYCDVEFDLATGARARRGRGTLAALAQHLPPDAGALVVNNGAAALALVVSALAVATGRPEVVLSRGEFVEIGDGFRIPELLESVGAQIREVGTTNRTHLRDYEAAIGARTGIVLKVHPSNFAVRGFTSAVPVADLAPVCRAAGTPLVVDIGSGLLAPDALLPDEPDARTMLAAAADLVTSSGDKLLGGPQAGLVLGDAGVVERVRRHPLARAVRVDKTTLAALEATLRAPTPTHVALHAPAPVLRERADALAEAIVGRAPGLPIEVVPSAGAVGGGGAPGLELPGWAVALPEALAAPLRLPAPSDTDVTDLPELTDVPAVVGRLDSGRLLLDVRALDPADLPTVAAAVAAAATIATTATSGHRPTDGRP